MFRFAVFGAGNIARRMVGVINRLEDCAVVAIGSKSLERAQRFAEQNQIAAAYGDYEELLIKEKPDCVYIATTNNFHYELTMLCLEHHVGVLCEKAAFQNERQAENVIAMAREKNTFFMEALWSRFLPVHAKVKEWIAEEVIGPVTFSEINIGFVADPDPNNRMYNPALGGGAAGDISCYTYLITTGILGNDYKRAEYGSLIGETGVDLTDHITLYYEDKVASMHTTIEAKLEQKMVIYGRKGRIVIPDPHFTMDAFLYDNNGVELMHFHDAVTEDGFCYEAAEVVRCIRNGLIESPVVPHKDTLMSAKIMGELSHYGHLI